MMSIIHGVIRVGDIFKSEDKKKRRSKGGAASESRTEESLLAIENSDTEAENSTNISLVVTKGSSSTASGSSLRASVNDCYCSSCSPSFMVHSTQESSSEVQLDVESVVSVGEVLNTMDTDEKEALLQFDDIGGSTCSDRSPVFRSMVSFYPPKRTSVGGFAYDSIEEEGDEREEAFDRTLLGENEPRVLYVDAHDLSMSGTGWFRILFSFFLHLKWVNCE